MLPSALRNPEMAIPVQKCPSYSGALNLEMPADSEIVLEIAECSDP